MRWRIYYGDGSTYSDRDGDAYQAPVENVQVISQSDRSSAKGWILMHGRLTQDGYYCWRSDGYGWDLHEPAGFWDYMFHFRGPKAVIFGRTIPTDDFHKIVGRASEEGLG